jgi:ankyrin repeat protein
MRIFSIFIIVFYFLSFAAINSYGCACCVDDELDNLWVSNSFSLIVTTRSHPAGDSLEIFNFDGNIQAKISEVSGIENNVKNDNLKKVIDSLYLARIVSQKERSFTSSSWYKDVKAKLNLEELRIYAKPLPIKIVNDVRSAAIKYYDDSLKTEIPLYMLFPDVDLCKFFKHKNCKDINTNNCFTSIPKWEIKNTFKTPKNNEFAIINFFVDGGCCPEYISKDMIVFMNKQSRKSAISAYKGFKAYGENKISLAKKFFEESVKYNPDFEIPRFSLASVLSLQNVPFDEGKIHLEKLLSYSGSKRYYLLQIEYDQNLSFWRKDQKYIDWIAQFKSNDSAELKNFSLHQAIENSNRNQIVKLIDNGANVDEMNDEGLSPLHMATLKENKGIVALLIVAGANVDIKSPVTENTPLHIASSLGNDSLLDIFLNEGANFNSKNKNGDTALHIAAKNGFNSIVEKLIQKKINVNTSNKKGKTAMHIASAEGHSTIVKMLIESGANQYLKDLEGKTARNYAISSGQQNVVIYLDNQKNEEIIKHQSNPTNAIVDENIQALTDQKENLLEQANILRQDLLMLNQKVEQISIQYRKRIALLRPNNRPMSTQDYNKMEKVIYQIEQEQSQAIAPFMQDAQFKIGKLKRIEVKLKEIENKLKLFEQ